MRMKPNWSVRGILVLLQALLQVLLILGCSPTTANPPAPVIQLSTANRECRRPASNTTCDRISSGLVATASNPQGRWSLGWEAALGSPLELYDSFRLNPTGFTGGEGIAYWTKGAAPRPCIALNPTCQPFATAGTQIPPGAVVLQPGAVSQYSVARWSPGHSGAFHIRAVFSGLSGHDGLPSTTSDVHVRRGAAELSSGKINLEGAGNTFLYDDRVPVAVGEVIDFAVGTGNGDAGHDGTGVDIEICE
jgi:hypothetical protein